MTDVITNVSPNEMCNLTGQSFTHCIEPPIFELRAQWLRGFAKTGHVAWAGPEGPRAVYPLMGRMKRNPIYCVQ